jgi:acetyl esterase/lipase
MRRSARALPPQRLGNTRFCFTVAAMTARAAEPDFTLVDPELRAALAAMPPLDFAAQFRDGKRLPQPEIRDAPPRPDIRIEEEMAPGLAGAPAVKVLVINRGAENRLRPAVLFMHGGGYIGGSIWRQLFRMQDTAKAHDCVVISVDYRVAPETPFPGARDDCYAALIWLRDNAARLGVDAARIVMLGESAGGGLAAQVALLARERGGLPILAQVLVYPMLDDRTGTADSVPPHIGTHVWTRVSNRFGWKCYLGAEPGGNDAPAGAVPAREVDLAGLPPAWIGVGGLDLFVTENIAFAERLMAAGVATELLVVPGAYHGFNRSAPGAAVSKSFDAAWNDALARYFAAALPR